MKASNEIKPRDRQETLSGVTRRVQTGCGALFVTVNEQAGKPFEVFATLGRAGGCAAAQTETIGRFVSLNLRAELDAAEIVQQLRGVRCHRPAEGALSCADAIARALDEQIKTGSHPGGPASRQFTPPNAGGAHHSPGGFKGE